MHCARINLDAYDAAGRMNSVASPAGPTTYGYLAASHQGDNYASDRRTLIDYPGVLQIDQDFTDRLKRLTVPTTSAGPNITNLWDTTGRLTETKLVNGGTTFNRHAYVLNAAHQRTKQTRPDASYVDYTYDDAGQLSTALSYTSGGSPITTEQLKYGYDAAQNLTKRTNNATVTTYSVNSLNQITSDGGASWTHDNNGNRTYQPNGVGSYNYTYDDENQLVQAETDTSSTPTGSRWKTLWTYDARGRVRVREDYGWYAPGSYFLLSKTTRYLYDGMRVIQERNASNVPQVTYTRGLDLAGSWERAGGIGGLLARTAHSGANGVTYTPAFYHADGNGNVTYLLRMDQTMGATYQFDPYGRQLASSGTLANANTYRFSSKELMLSSGFYYYGYRFYDPNTQRWLNRDPIQESGGINLYGFVGSDPITNFDPNGECVALPAVVIGGGALIGVAWLGHELQNYYQKHPLPSIPWPSFNNETAEGTGRAEPAPAPTPPSPVKDVPESKPPFTGNPGETVRGGTQTTTYGPDGYPDVQRDLPHPDESAPGNQDHSHDWTRPPGGGPPLGPPKAPNPFRGPPRPPKPSDPPPPRGPGIPPPNGPTSCTK